MTKIKICGLSRGADVKIVNELQPDYIGFVFARKSKRYVDPKTAELLKAKLDTQIKAVGVFVNEPMDRIRFLIEKGIIDAVQLHGCENEEDIRTLKSISGVPIMKAFQVSSVKDIDIAKQSAADYILLDHGCGTGIPFDWSILPPIERPFFLAGGLNGANVAEAIEKYRPYAVDVSSGVETNGCKDYHKVKDFIKTVRRM